MKKQSSNSSKTLKAIVGSAAAAILISIVSKFEGDGSVGYFDIVGMPTKCYGDTSNVVIGKRYSEEECLQSLNEQLIKHAEPILKCVPQLKGRTYPLAASVSFAYNFGVSAFCNSGSAGYFRKGDFANGCKALNEDPETGKEQWVFVKDKLVKDEETGAWKWTYKKLPGLVKRRAEERAICERGLK